METKKIDRQAAVAQAAAAWDKAPMHVKAMAGAYVAPLLAALAAVGAELDAMRAEIQAMKEQNHD